MQTRYVIQLRGDVDPRNRERRKAFSVLMVDGVLRREQAVNGVLSAGASLVHWDALVLNSANYIHNAVPVAAVCQYEIGQFRTDVVLLSCAQLARDNDGGANASWNPE